MGQSYVFSGKDRKAVYQAAQSFAGEARSSYQRRAAIDRIFRRKTGEYTTIVNVCGSPIPALKERAAHIQRQIGSP